MNEDDRDLSVPEATHWNTRRDPIESFGCPQCGQRVSLKGIINPPPGFSDIFAECPNCCVGYTANDWRHFMLEKWQREE